ncbi:MAG: glycosyltransferase [Alphaproteobacteria bacterium]|nr:glycosyltransferase [Alphaproteobacteria bacterium]
MEATPPVIVIMSAYNNAGTVQAALDSLQAQTYPNWILLATDDGSGDLTPALLQEYAALEPRMRLFLHKDNQGIAARLNDLIAVALDEHPESLIARMDADDICDPARFEKQITAMRNSPAIGVLGSWGRCIAPDGSPVKETVETATDHDQIAINGFFSAPLLHPSVMMRPDILRKLGQPVYDPTLRRAQDYDLWARLTPHTRFAVLPEYLLTYRLGSDKKAGFDKENDLNVYRRRIVDRNLARLGLNDKDENWKAAAYALTGFPLPKAKINSTTLENALQDIISANDLSGLYNAVLFKEKLAEKHRKALRRTHWWTRLF